MVTGKAMSRKISCNGANVLQRSASSFIGIWYYITRKLWRASFLDWRLGESVFVFMYWLLCFFSNVELKRNMTEDLVIVVVANKLDLALQQREVALEEAQKYIARVLGPDTQLYEVSAKDDNGKWSLRIYFRIMSKKLHPYRYNRRYISSYNTGSCWSQAISSKKKTTYIFAYGRGTCSIQVVMLLILTLYAKNKSITFHTFWLSKLNSCLTLDIMLCIAIFCINNTFPFLFKSLFVKRKKTRRRCLLYE